MISQINLSKVLITVICAVAVFYNLLYDFEDDLFQIMMWLLIGPLLSFLLAFYCYAYRGKGHQAARNLLVIAVVLTVVTGGLFMLVLSKGTFGI